MAELEKERAWPKQLSPTVRLRAHILLLLAPGHPWSLIAEVLFCSIAIVARWIRRFTPLDFGYLRSRWCGATLALVLKWIEDRGPFEFEGPIYTELRAALNT